MNATIRMLNCQRGSVGWHRLISTRLLAIAEVRTPLAELLDEVVGANSWIEQFDALPMFGVGDLSNPYVRMCRAECMLAAYMLHVECSKLGDVDFIEEERLEALRDAPSSACEKCMAAAQGMKME